MTTRIFLYLSIICVCLFFMGWVVRGAFPSHDCKAPCTVHFPNPMAEDTYTEDYHNRVLDVYWVAPDKWED
jgi:hypothetical protein